MAKPLEKFESCSLSDKLKFIRMYLSSPWAAVQLHGIQKIEDFLSQNKNPIENDLFLGMVIGAFFRDEPIRSRSVRIMEKFFPQRWQQVGGKLETFYNNRSPEHLKPIVKTALDLLNKEDCRRQVYTKPGKVNFFEPDFRFGLDLLKLGTSSGIFLFPNDIEDEDGEYYAGFLRELCKEKEFDELLGNNQLGDFLIKVFAKAQDQFVKRRVAEFFGETSLPLNDSADAFGAVLVLIRPPETEVHYDEENWQVIQAGINSAITVFSNSFFRDVRETILYFLENMTDEEITVLKEMAKKARDEIWFPENEWLKCLKTERLIKAYKRAEENRHALVKVLEDIFFSQDLYVGKKDSFKDINRNDVIAALGRLGDHESLIGFFKKAKTGINCTSVSLTIDAWNRAMVSNLQYLSPGNRALLSSHFLNLQSDKKVKELCLHLMYKKIPSIFIRRDPKWIKLIRDNCHNVENALKTLFFKVCANGDRRLLFKETLNYYHKLDKMHNSFLTSKKDAEPFFYWLKRILSNKKNFNRLEPESLKKSLIELLNQPSGNNIDEKFLSYVEYIELFTLLELPEELSKIENIERALARIQDILLSNFVNLWALLLANVSGLDQLDINNLKDIVEEILNRMPTQFEILAPLIDILKNKLKLEFSYSLTLPEDKQMMEMRALYAQQGYSAAAILHLIRNDETLNENYEKENSVKKKLRIWLESIRRDIMPIFEFPSNVHSQILKLTNKDDISLANYAVDESWAELIPILMKPPFSFEDMPELFDLFAYLMKDHRTKPQYDYHAGGLAKHIRKHMSGEAAYHLYRQWAGETGVIDQELVRFAWRNLIKAGNYAIEKELPPLEIHLPKEYSPGNVSSLLVKGLSNLNSQGNLVERAKENGIIPLDDVSGSYKNCRVAFACSVPDIPKVWNIVTAKPDFPEIVSTFIDHKTDIKEGDSILGKVEKIVENSLLVDLGPGSGLKGIWSDWKGDPLSHFDHIYPFMVKNSNAQGHFLLSKEDFNVKFRDRLIKDYEYFPISVQVNAVEDETIEVCLGNISLEIPIEEVSWGEPQLALTVLKDLKERGQSVQICVTHIQGMQKACISFKRRKPIWTLEDLALYFGTTAFKMIFVEEEKNQLIFEICPGTTRCGLLPPISPGILCRINAEHLVNKNGQYYHPHIVCFPPRQGEVFEVAWQLPDEDSDVEHAWQRQGDPMLKIQRLPPYQYHLHDAFKPGKSIQITPTDDQLWSQRPEKVKIVDKEHQFEDQAVMAKINWPRVHVMILKHIDLPDQSNKHAKIISCEDNELFVDFTTDELEENFEFNHPYPLRVIGHSIEQLEVAYPGVKSKMFIDEDKLNYNPEVMIENFKNGREIQGYFIRKDRQSRLLFSMLGEPEVYRSLDRLQLPIECVYLDIQDGQYVWMEMPDGHVYKIAMQCFAEKPRFVIGDRVRVRFGDQEGKAIIELIKEGRLAYLIKNKIPHSGKIINKELHDIVLVGFKASGLRYIVGSLRKEDQPEVQNSLKVNFIIERARLHFPSQKLYAELSSVESAVKGIEEIKENFNEKERFHLWGKIKEWNEEGLVVEVQNYDSSIRFIVPYKEISYLPYRRDPQYKGEIKNSRRPRSFRVIEPIDTSRKIVTLSLRQGRAMNLKQIHDNHIDTETGIAYGEAVLIDSDDKKRIYYFETKELINCRVDESEIEISKELQYYFNRQFRGGQFNFEIRDNRLVLKSVPTTPLRFLLGERHQPVYQCHLSNEGHYWKLEPLDDIRLMDKTINTFYLSPMQAAPQLEDREMVMVTLYHSHIDTEKKIAYCFLSNEQEQERQGPDLHIYRCCLMKGESKYRVNFSSATQTIHTQMKNMNCFLSPLDKDPEKLATSVILSYIDEDSQIAYFKLWDGDMEQRSEIRVNITEPKTFGQPWIAYRKNEHDMRIPFTNLTAVLSLQKFGLIYPGHPLLHQETLKFRSEEYSIAFIKTEKNEPFLSFVSKDCEPVIMLDRFFSKRPPGSRAVFTILRDVHESMRFLEIECLPGMNYFVPLSRFDGSFDLKKLRLNRGDRLIVCSKKYEGLAFPSFRWKIDMVITDRWLFNNFENHHYCPDIDGVIPRVDFRFIRWDSDKTALHIEYQDRSIRLPISALTHSQRSSFYWLKKGDELSGYLRITHENIPYSEHCIFEINDVKPGKSHKFEEPGTFSEGCLTTCTIKEAIPGGFIVNFGKEDEQKGVLPFDEMKMLLNTPVTEIFSKELINLQIPVVMTSSQKNAEFSYDKYLFKHVQHFKPGSYLPGRVKRHWQNGVLMEFPGFIIFVHYMNLLHGYMENGLLPLQTRINCQVVEWNPGKGKIELNHVLVHKELLQMGDFVNIIHKDETGKFLIVMAQESYGVVNKEFVPEGIWDKLSERVLIGHLQLKEGTRLFVRRLPSSFVHNKKAWIRSCKYFPSWFEDCIANIWEDARNKSKPGYELIRFTQILKENEMPQEIPTIISIAKFLALRYNISESISIEPREYWSEIFGEAVSIIKNPVNLIEIHQTGIGGFKQVAAVLIAVEHLRNHNLKKTMNPDEMLKLWKTVYDMYQFVDEKFPGLPNILTGKIISAYKAKLQIKAEEWIEELIQRLANHFEIFIQPYWPEKEDLAFQALDSWPGGGNPLKRFNPLESPENISKVERWLKEANSESGLKTYRLHYLLACLNFVWQKERNCLDCLEEARKAIIKEEFSSEESDMWQHRIDTLKLCALFESGQLNERNEKGKFEGFVEQLKMFLIEHRPEEKVDPDLFTLSAGLALGLRDYVAIDTLLKNRSHYLDPFLWGLLDVFLSNRKGQNKAIASLLTEEKLFMKKGQELPIFIIE